MELDPKYCDVIRRRWAEFTRGEGCDWQSLTPAENGEESERSGDTAESAEEEHTGGSEG